MSDSDNSQKSPPVIMIVDGDPYVRKLAGYFLTEAGYQVEYASDGYEALDKSRLAPPDVMLLELMIPRLHGLSLCRLLKSDPVTQNIRIVVFTEVLAAQESAQIAGADSFLSKPVEKTRLVDAVSKVAQPMRNNLL